MKSHIIRKLKVKKTSTFKAGTKSNSVICRFFDLIILIASLYLAAEVYEVSLGREYLIVLLVVLVAFLYVAEGVDLYRSWRAGTLRSMVLNAWLTLTISFAALVIFAFIFKFSEMLSRVTIVCWFAFSFVNLFLWRLILRSYKVNRRKLGFNIKKTAIIGATDTGVRIAQQIGFHKELGYYNVGFFEDRSPKRVFKNQSYIIEGSVNDAVNRARNGEIDVIFIALPLKAEKRIADILGRLGDTTVDVYFIPDFFLSNLIHARIDHVGDIDTLSVFESPYLGIKEWVKRSEDIILGLIILAVISPVLLIIAFCIKCTSNGPILFKQDRYGLAGQKIKVWKFRSMTVTENSDVVKQATKNDSRITPLGSFLRRTSLDELPQFFNVITGDMSIVGPRPHAVSHNEEYRKKVEFYMLRHKVKPGITGWAQINGWRGETDTLEKMENRVDHDLQYIKHWSLWFDLKIIVITVFKGFTGKNAY
ncbi:undecaprenyl-phosphate glucose phosphotransferase [Pseudoalteromonas sp. NBT06-2]|nr:undecaprenyl-phosphate glucose phosphotransferase [Pseudoalteromonas sp. NBT06-2]